MSSSANEVQIRLAKYSELYACAQTIAKSFHDDVLFGRYIHPFRHQYPDDMLLFFYRLFQSEYFDWSMAFVVATVKDDAGNDRIVGLAQWHRLGDTAVNSGWGLPIWDPRSLLQPTTHLISKITSQLRPNRAIAPSRSDILERSAPYTDHLWEGPRSERWYLHFLGVHPDHWGKSIGRKLVAWGLDQARREGVGASVVAADGKDNFYQRCGFKECIGRAGQGEGNPLAEIPGGNIWWVSPERSSGQGNGEKGDS